MKRATSIFGRSLACTLATATVFAAVDPQAVTIRDILTQQTQLRTEISSGKGAFKRLSRQDRDTLLQKQHEAMTLLQGVSTVEELRPEQRVIVFNNLEEIKAAVTKAEDDRMVCEYSRQVGSNMRKSVCLTAREWREHRDRSRDTLNREFKCGESSLACTGDERNSGLGGN